MQPYYIGLISKVLRNGEIYKIDYRGLEHTIKRITDFDGNQLLPERSTYLKNEFSDEEYKQQKELVARYYHQVIANGYMAFWNMFSQLVQDSLVVKQEEVSHHEEVSKEEPHEKIEEPLEYLFRTKICGFYC